MIEDQTALEAAERLIESRSFDSIDDFVQSTGLDSPSRIIELPNNRELQASSAEIDNAEFNTKEVILTGCNRGTALGTHSSRLAKDKDFAPNWTIEVVYEMHQDPKARAAWYKRVPKKHWHYGPQFPEIWVAQSVRFDVGADAQNTKLDLIQLFNTFSQISLSAFASGELEEKGWWVLVRCACGHKKLKSVVESRALADADGVFGSGVARLKCSECGVKGSATIAPYLPLQSLKPTRVQPLSRMPSDRGPERGRNIIFHDEDSLFDALGGEPGQNVYVGDGLYIASDDGWRNES